MPMSRRNFLEAGIMAGVAPSLPGRLLGREDAPGVKKTATLTVAEYVVQRLAALGIRHVFGVPGDYAFPIAIAIEKCDGLTWVGCSNELNAAYAADGYARIYGTAMLSTTYNVGAAAALAGVMGCKAERLPVFHVVGSPSNRLEKAGLHMHHSYGDGNLAQFLSYHNVSICASAFLTPQNAISEMERVIQAAASQRMPVYIQVPEDYANTPVEGQPVPNVPFAQTPTFSSDPAQLNAVFKAITDRIEKADYTVILASFILARYGLNDQLDRLVKTSQIPFVTTGMSKAILPDSNPLNLGMYNGSFTPKISAMLDHADLIIDLGGVIFCDGETGEFGHTIDPAKIVTVRPDRVEMPSADSRQSVFTPVHIKDVIARLIQTPPSPKRIPIVEKLRADWERFDRLVEKVLFHKLSGLLKPNDILVADTESAIS